MQPKIGILINNLGTPAAPTRLAVWRYLKEFLGDGRVIDLPAILRWGLVNIVIAPFRASGSAHAYATVWQPRGSPLRYLSQDLADALQQQLPQHYQVALGMQYGQPSIKAALNQLLAAGCQQIIALPLYPQYASATTGSSIERLFAALAKQWTIPNLTVINAFYQHPAFIEAQAALAKPILAKEAPQKIIMSFHGLPLRHLQRSETQICEQSAPCPLIHKDNQSCYRAQCYATARALAKSLELTDNDYEVAFQSRLGRIPWTQPYITELLPKLRQQGIEKIVVLCPSFIVDCLETLEEIAIRLKADWLALGGTTFTVVPCVNQDPLWVKGLAQLLLTTSTSLQ
jgi:ferrochelatase